MVLIGSVLTGKGSEMEMIRVNLDMDMPEECHECPFQLKFKGDEVDAWYMRRCVIMHRKIEYPRPEWCPLKEQEPLAVYEGKVNKCVCGNGINRYWHPEYCGFCGKKLVWY